MVITIVCFTMLAVGLGVGLHANTTALVIVGIAWAALMALVPD